MATSHKRTQRKTDPRDISRTNAPTGAKSAVVLDAAANGELIRRRADALDADAAYYRHRAIQEERALGPGYYVDLLRKMASHQAAMAQQLRASKGTPQRSGSAAPSAPA
jgi:hypothetical protein